MDLKTLLYGKDNWNTGRNLHHLDQITPKMIGYYKCCGQCCVVNSTFSTKLNKFRYTNEFCQCEYPPYLKDILADNTLFANKWVEITITIRGNKTIYNPLTRRLVNTKTPVTKPLMGYEWLVQATALYQMLIDFKSKILQHTNFIMVFEKQENGNIHSHVALNMYGIKMGFDEFQTDLKKYLKSRTNAYQHSITTIKDFVKWYKYIFKYVQSYDYIRNNGDILRTLIDINKIKYIDIIYDSDSEEDNKEIHEETVL